MSNPCLIYACGLSYRPLAMRWGSNSYTAYCLSQQMLFAPSNVLPLNINQTKLLNEGCGFFQSLIHSCFKNSAFCKTEMALSSSNSASVNSASDCTLRDAAMEVGWVLRNSLKIWSMGSELDMGFVLRFGKRTSNSWMEGSSRASSLK